MNRYCLECCKLIPEERKDRAFCSDAHQTAYELKRKERLHNIVGSRKTYLDRETK